jgi:hypothetical protein
MSWQIKIHTRMVLGLHGYSLKEGHPMASSRNLKLWTVNIISLVLITLLAVTGLVNWLVLPHGGGRREGFLIGTRHVLMDMHAWLGVFFLLTIAIHLVLHWPTIKANLNRSGLLKK